MRRSSHSARVFFAILLVSALLACFAFLTNRPVSAVPTTMNFQGRLADSSGNIVANGLYNMQFRLFTASSGGSSVWNETRETTNRVQVTNGLFTTKLGEVSAIPASLFASGNLYFEITLATPGTATCSTASCASWEAAMTPRHQLSTSAYAFNSDTLDGIDSTAFAQLGNGNAFTGNNTFSGTSGFTNTVNVNVSNANALQVRNGATNLFNVDTSGSAVTIGQTDGTGVVLALDVKNTTGDPSGSNGAIYYNSFSSRFRCFQGGAWADCISGAGASGTLQNTYDNSGTPATITTTAAKGVRIAAGAAPTVDLFTVSNTGQPVTTAGVGGIQVDFVGGAAAVEASGVRVDLTPGTTSGGTWNGFRVVANATGAVSGVNENGITIDGPTSPGAGTETGVQIGTGWDIGVDIQSGGIQLAVQTDPTSVAAGNLRIYAKDIAGKILPKFVGPSGVDTPLQAHFGFNRIAMMSPAGSGTNCSTSLSIFGSTVTGAGTCSYPTITSTNLKSSVRRLAYSSGTTAGTVAYHRQAALMTWRGNAAGIGGFFYTTRFSLNTLQAGNRAFVGLSDSIANPTNVDPTTNTTPGKVGMAINASTGNWNFVHNITGTAPTVVPLGANFPVNNTDLLELILFSAPNGSSIGYRVQNLSTSQQTSGSISTNIPATATFLNPIMWITNNATGAAAIIETAGWYLESDV